MSHESVYEILTPSGMDYAAMGVAFVAAFVLSFIWWGPLFGRKWAALQGMDPDEAPSMALPLVLQVIATLLTVYVLWHVMQAFVAVPVHGGDAEAGLQMGRLGVGLALFGAVMTWIGFYVPVQLVKVAWEQAPWALFGINVGGHLVSLCAMGVVFALFQ